ncbi:IPT/TIG domain-containing protein [Ereboglobus luteus]|uniref:IPT/TIG domain-containing protein n=1 Tax=Ereboglobus luteus TaxID=1796921 RepID=A0A2U8E5D6_9BACT|nr:IPT/TIG domain-containing protein [Ereboglobus luteus]AWI10148.1 hypothetical protein CKA38_13570 [Ereboglobus luteus]
MKRNSRPHAFAIAIIFTILAAPLSLAPLRATIATSLDSFTECEPPQSIYYPLLGSGTFVSEAYAGSQTDQSTGVMRMAFRYRNDATAQGTWWDGDGNTANTDRQRSEVKGLGANQRNKETFEYSTTWRCNPDLVTTGSFFHFFQLKSIDGSNDGRDTPLVAVGIVATGTAAVSYSSGKNSKHTVVREFPYTPGTWQTITLRVTTSGSDQTTGAVRVSVDGDAFTGTSDISLYRDQTFVYQPRWGIYRGISSTAADTALGDAYIEHLYPTANRYSENSAPRIVSFRPKAAVAGSILSIYGIGLNKSAVITINGVTAPVVPAGNTTGFYIMVPDNVTGGPVVVRTDSGIFVAQEQFTLNTTTPAPIVTDVSPLDAKTNDTITITGTNLTDATAIIGGVIAQSRTIPKDSTLTVTVPAEATSGTIVVSTPGGTVTATQTLNLSPIITDVSPTSAKTSHPITITGVNLTGASVTIGGVKANVANNSNTTIRVTLPYNAISGPIVVTTPNGSVTAAQTFTLIPTPSVNRISPAFAQIGDTITLHGTNLGSVTTVTIGGVDAPVIFNDGTTIKTTVPAGAAHSNIDIKDYDGAHVFCPSSIVIITDEPSITIEPHTALVTLAGTPGVSGTDNGPASNALFAAPNGLVTDRAGNLYIADTGNHVIRRLAPDGQVTTLAGTPGLSGATDGPAANALFNFPRGLAISPDNTTLYVADPGNLTARAINLTTNQVITIASIELYPYGLATDPAGNLYISDLLGPPASRSIPLTS